MGLISLVFITLAAILSCKETVARCECHNRESLESTAVGTHISERSLLISLDSFCMYRASHILLFSNSLEQTASERWHAWLTNCQSTCTARSMYYFFHRLGVQERVHRSVWSWDMKSKVLIWSWKGVSLNRISVQKAEGHANFEQWHNEVKQWHICLDRNLYASAIPCNCESRNTWPGDQ